LFESNVTAPRQKQYNLDVCVRPAYGPRTSTRDLVQFLIYYLVAGADHFTFYNTNGIAPEMMRVIRKAQELGVPIEVVPITMCSESKV